MSMAAWGHLDAASQQLKILNFELGVLLLPSLEAAYQRHPHRGFSCTAAAAAGAGSGGSSSSSSSSSSAGLAPAAATVELWSAAGLRQQQAAGAAAEAAAGSGAAVVALALPYPLPPARYGPGDLPWAGDRPDCGSLVDVAGVEYSKRRWRAAAAPAGPAARELGEQRLGQGEGERQGEGEKEQQLEHEEEQEEEEEVEEDARMQCWSWFRASRWGRRAGQQDTWAEGDQDRQAGRQAGR
jgi:hypothetical protein